jgi:3-dehydroquinate synthase
MTDTTVIGVAGDQPYDITIGRGILGMVGDALPPAAQKVLIVHPPTLSAAATELRASLLASGERQVLLAEVPDAEQGKRVEVAAFCWQVMGQADFTRTDAVVGFGGGAVTDLAGFVAATWLRGVAVVQVPTTVLGMVDAAVGGKTGINTAEGKNLVGAFWPPRAVICDLALLDTLSRNERVAGFAEVVKAGFIWYPEILDSSRPTRGRRRPAVSRVPPLHRAGDRDEGARRRRGPARSRAARVLNYGHTLGHAIEHAERYQWRHGAAISIGMLFAAELSRLAGRLSDDAAARHRRILELLGLPTSYRAGAWKQLLATMQRDKKTRGAMLRFIVLDDIAKPTVLQAPDESCCSRPIKRSPSERARRPARPRGGVAGDPRPAHRGRRRSGGIHRFPVHRRTGACARRGVLARARARARRCPTRPPVHRRRRRAVGRHGDRPAPGGGHGRSSGSTRDRRARRRRRRVRGAVAAGSGLLGRLVDVAAAWAADRGADELTLDVHAENHRAQGAYRKVGFVATGERLTSVIGPELVMVRAGRVSA